MSQEISQDAVVEANREMLLRRSQFGIAKYGVTLAGSGLTRRQLLQHALEEALDLANYIQAEILRHDATEATAWCVTNEKGELFVCDFGLATLSEDSAKDFAKWAADQRPEWGTLSARPLIFG